MIQNFSLAVSIIFTLFVVFVLYRVYQFQIKQSYSNVSEITLKNAKQIELDFEKRFSFLNSMKNSIESGLLDNRQEGLSYLKKMTQATHDFQGIYIMYENNGFDGNDDAFKGRFDLGSNNSGHYNPWYYWENNEVVLGETSSEYFDEDYYAITKNANTQQLIEPYIDEDIKILMSSFTAPLQKNGSFVGIVGGDVTLEFLDQMISEIKIFETGYAFLLSKEGTFISFPNKELIGKQTLAQYAEENKRSKLAQMATAIQKGENGYIEAKDPFRKKDAVFFYQTIGNSQWAVVSVVPKSEILAELLRLFIGMLIIAIVSLMVFIYIAKTIADKIVQPILKMTHVLEEISAGQGDLTVSIEVHSNDELEDMAHYFNQFVGNLKRMMLDFIQKNEVISKQSNQLNESAHSLLKQSSDINQDVEVLSNNSEKVFAEIFTIKSSVEEAEANIGSLADEMNVMNQEVNSVVSSSQSTSQLVNQVNGEFKKVVTHIEEITSNVSQMTEEMKSSSVAVSEMNSSISEVAKHAQYADQIATEAKGFSSEAQNAMKELDHATQEIKKIVKMIEQVTDQTNMLALNATIEAASAGEAGKGFAVVANEVKTLARDTANATQEIGNRIDQIDSHVKNVILLFNRMIEIIQKLYDINHSISMTVDQQASATNEISSSVENSANSAVQIDSYINQIRNISLSVMRSFEDTVKYISKISDNTKQINEISNDVTRNSQEAHAGVNEISQSTSHINENIIQMGENVNQIAKSAELSSLQANQLNQIASELINTVEAINQITGKFKVK